MKKLGFGLMRLPQTDPQNAAAVDIEHTAKMADKFLAEGFTYFDTAACYHSGSSETAFREAVAKRYPRDAYTITDKLSLFMIKDKSEFPSFFEGQLQRLGVDYLDYYLLHALGEGPFKQAEEMGAFEFMSRLKAEGRVKHIGFSFHDKADVLEKILTKHPEAEYVQLQLNYADWDDPNVQSRKCYEVCVKHNKPVIVMEPVKGGALANVPADAEKLFKGAAPDMSAASWAIRFAASLNNVVMVLSGMSNQEQARDNISYMKDFKPLTEDEKGIVARALEIIRAKDVIPCTGCRYCVDDCPKKIAIPDCFKLMNGIIKQGEGQISSAKEEYGRLIQSGKGKASDCVKCGKCESLCPQHLEIRRLLENSAAMLEG